MILMVEGCNFLESKQCVIKAHMMEILAGILGTENALQKFEKDDHVESYVLSVVFASPDLM